jgi:hypothetical protein
MLSVVGMSCPRELIDPPPSLSPRATYNDLVRSVRPSGCLWVGAVLPRNSSSRSLYGQTNAKSSSLMLCDDRVFCLRTWMMTGIARDVYSAARFWYEGQAGV